MVMIPSAGENQWRRTGPLELQHNRCKVVPQQRQRASLNNKSIAAEPQFRNRKDFGGYGNYTFQMSILQFQGKEAERLALNCNVRH